MNGAERRAEARPGIGPDGWGAQVGQQLLEVTPERVRARIEIAARHHQPYGIVHGGVYCSIVEGVASVGAGTAAMVAGQRGVVGVANATDFLRSHSAAQGALLAEGVPLHTGRSLALWQVEIRRESDGKLVARGQVRFHVLTELPAERQASQASAQRAEGPQASAASAQRAEGPQASAASAQRAEGERSR